MPAIPDDPRRADAQDGIGHRGRFWEQVCSLGQMGEDGIADPFAAISAIPAASGAIRDMTAIRFEVPEFIAEKCTGCSQCWTQCPDSAIPGVVSEPAEVLEAAIRSLANSRRLRPPAPDHQAAGQRGAAGAEGRRRLPPSPTR